VDVTADREHKCPRRNEAPYQLAPGPDRWDNRASQAGGIGPSCSYCGSLDPDTFMEKIREGWYVGPTDKPYKAYLQKPYTAEDLQRIKTASDVWKTAKRVKLDDGLDEEAATAAADEHWNQHEAPGLTGTTVAKLYYQHLSQAQRDEFIELHNSEAMKIGFPGYLYMLPFFTRSPGAAK
jgi:hypothetical protein